MKYIMLAAAMLVALPALAAEPVKLGDSQLDNVTAGRDRGDFIRVDTRSRLNMTRSFLQTRFERNNDPV